MKFAQGVLLGFLCLVTMTGQADACRRGRSTSHYGTLAAPSARIYASFGTDEAAKAKGTFTVNVRNYSSFTVAYGTVTCNNPAGGYEQLQFGSIPPGGTASKTVPFTPHLIGVFFKDGPGPDWGPGTIANNNPNLQYVNLDLYNQP